MSSAEDLKKLGNTAFANGDFTAAIEHYSNAIALDDTNHVFFSNRSGSYAALNQWHKALSDAQQCVKLNPNFVKGHTRAAQAYQQLGKLDEAKASYKAALALDPSNASYQQELAQVEAALLRRQQAEDMMNPFGGDIFAKLAKWPITKQMSENPTVKAALLDIQRNPQNMERYVDNQAVTVCINALLGISPEEQQKMAQQQYEEEQRRKAAEEKRANRAAFSSTPSMQREKAQEKPVEPEVELTEEEKAERAAKAEIRAKADVEKEKGAAFYKKKQFDEAITQFQAAFDIDATNPVYLMNIAACQFEQGKYEDAIKTCNDAMAISGITPNQKSKTLARQANAYAKLKQFDTAIATYKRAILEDTNPTARQQLRQCEADYKQWKIESYYDDAKSEEARLAGNDAFTAGNWAEAEKHYTEAIKRNPKNAKCWGNRAAVYIKLAMWEPAMKDCDEALKLDPKFVKAMIRKGKVLHFLKSYAAAMDIYQNALEIANDSEKLQLQEEIMATQRAIYSNSGSPEADEARLQQALRSDPSLALLLQSPQTQALLQELNDPQKAMLAMQNPDKAQVIERLIAAGIIKLG